MSIKIPTTDFSINSIIGESSSCSGDFVSRGPLRVDGKFTGSIKSTSKVFIGKKGYAEGSIIAKNLVIGGTIKGDVFIEGNLVALKTAEIIGNIYAVSVQMEDGVIFDGECRIIPKDMVHQKTKEFEENKTSEALSESAKNIAAKAARMKEQTSLSG